MLSRRTLLALAALPLAGGPAAADEDAWPRWCRAFLREDGRVVDALQGEASHSEGQGYGLVLALAHRDREAFERMEDWAQRNLCIRQDPLMGWLWRPGEGVVDWHNATDGDLFRAWALLGAARVFGRTEGLERARDIARHLAWICSAPDPRGPGRLLLPGAETYVTTNGIVVNPSYIMPRALAELGEGLDLPDLVALAGDGTRLLRELAAEGLPPDWLKVTPAGFAPAEGFSADSGYDAIRVGLFLAWSGLTDHPALRRQAAAWASASAPPGHVPVVLDRQGTPKAVSDAPGYVELVRLMRCAAGETGLPPPPSFHERQPYYAATLQLMARIAAAAAVPHCLG